jgi:lycopene cyclase domain-containing protein
MSYAVLNAYFLVPLVLLMIAFRWLIRWRRLCFTVAALLVLTAIFDNFIIASGIVDYDENLLSGVYIGFAPIEDFAYSVMAAVLIPMTWWWLGSREKK